MLPEDKQGPVLDDIRKISKERRRHWGTARIMAANVCPSAADGLTGVYRSTSELSEAITTSVNDESSGDRLANVQPRPADVDGGSLMATVRAARRRQSMSATVVYNPAFYDAPIASNGRSTVTAVSNPAGQPYLRMTPENGFSLYQLPAEGRRSSSDVTDYTDEHTAQP